MDMTKQRDRRAAAPNSVFTSIARMKELFPGEELVRLMVPRAQDDPEGDTLHLRINGEGIDLPVGATLQVPAGVAEVLAHAGL